MMTRKGVFVILAAMAASKQFAYEIRLEPDAAKRRTVSILKSQGPETAMLYLYAPAPWVIAGSAITAQDDNLWSGFNTTPNNYCHIYRMVSARSSQQYVTVFGQLTQPGDGYGINPWFKATVPAVDIDWVNHSGTGHEDDEDAWTGFCPLTKVQDQRTKVIVRKLKDDRSLVSASMTLECWPTTAVRFLKEDGVTALWSGATVSDLETPLTLYVDPQASGPFTVTLKGPSDDAFNRPTDYLTGVATKVKVVPVSESIDGSNSGSFSVTVEPTGLNVNSYQWVGQAPEGSGNNPQVNFANPNKSSSCVNNPHWFSFPDNRLASITGSGCNYTVNCIVNIGGLQCMDQEPPNWRVFVPMPAASTSWPMIVGMVSVSVRKIGDDRNEWYVSGVGSLIRTTPEINPHIPATSQFYNKIVTVHEGRHVTQWTSMSPWKDLFDAAGLYNSVLSTLTSTVSEQDLVNHVSLMIQWRNENDNLTASQSSYEREKDAFQQSNLVTPHYLEVDIP